MQYNLHTLQKRSYSENVSSITHLGQTVITSDFLLNSGKEIAISFIAVACCFFSYCHNKSGNVMKCWKPFLQGLTLLNILQRKTNKGFIITLEQVFPERVEKCKIALGESVKAFLMQYIVLNLKVQKLLY